MTRLTDAGSDPGRWPVIVAVTVACAGELAAAVTGGPEGTGRADREAGDRLAVAGDVLGSVARELRAAPPGAPATLAATLAGRVTGLLLVDGQVYVVASAGDVRDVLKLAAAPPGHDVPHWANGPSFGAPPPVNAICICTCAGCCGHCPGIAPPLGVPGRCPECSCYLAPGRGAR